MKVFAIKMAIAITAWLVGFALNDYILHLENSSSLMVWGGAIGATVAGIIHYPTE